MAYKPISIDPVLSTGANDVLRSAATGGVGANERIVIKQFAVINILPDGGATATVDVWKGVGQSDTTRRHRSVKLDPGQSLEKDPTFWVLEPGETLAFKATPAGSCAASAEGALSLE